MGGMGRKFTIKSIICDSLGQEE